MKCPVSVAVALAAICVTLAWWGGIDIEPLIGDGTDTRTRPWTLVTSMLPHAHIVHIYFNLYWWWRFATRMEFHWGGLALLGLTIALAVASAGAEFAVGNRGVGLSGVVYGQFAILWIVQKHDERFAGSISPRTAKYFAFWFFLCIVLTATNVMNIGNVAHGAGAAAGLLIGLAVASRAGKRVGYAVAASALIGTVTWGATFGAGTFSLMPWTMSDAMRGYKALERGEWEEAIAPLEAAVRQHPNDVASIANLGHAYQQTGKLDAALERYKQAVSLRPELREKYAGSIASILAKRAWTQSAAQDTESASSAIEEAVTWDTGNCTYWRMAGRLRAELEQFDDSRDAFSKARQNAKDSEYPRWEQAYELAAVEVRARDYETSARLLREATDANPTKLDLWFYLGESLEALGKQDEAVDAYTKAVSSPEMGEKAREAVERLRGKQ